MASATINGTTGNEYIDSKIVWSSTANNTANTSTVTASLYYRRNNTGYTTYGTGTFTINIGGSKTSVTKQLTIGTDWVLAVSGTETISHNTDGSKSITISATGSMPDTTLTSTSCSGTARLDTIPRASTIDSLSCSSKYFTGTLTYKYTPKSASYYNRCNISLNIDGAYTAVKTINLGKKNAAQNTATVALSESELSTIYNKLTSTTNGVLRFTFRTYSDSGYSTQVGDAGYKEVTLYIPNTTDTKPTVTMTLSPTSSLSSPFNALYIKGYTKVSASFTDGEGKYGASISSYSLTVQGSTDSTSPYTSGYLSTSGNVAVKGTVKDSRGYSRSYTQTISVLAYSKPKLLPVSGESDIICGRCDSSGNLTSSGTYLKIKAKRSYSKLTSGGTQNNYCLIRYRYRAESASSFSNWVTVLSKTASSDSIDTKLANVVSSTTTSYVVQVGVVDDMGKTAAVQFVIPTDSVTLHMADGGKRIGLLRYAEDSDEEGIDVGAPIHGGAVDNLTLGTMLGATSAAPISLNDITEVGNYYSPSATYSQYITNSPYTTGGFSLTVRELQSKNMIRQEMFYGRTNWQRHYSASTGEWSDWLRYLMTDYAETTAADFVSEIGVKYIDETDTDLGYWRYRKWKSGAVDLNGVFKVTPELDSTFSSIVRYSKQVQIPLPFKVESFQFVGTSGTNYFLMTNAAVNTDTNGDNSAAFRLFRFIDFAGDSTYIRIMASGKLKT